MKRSPMTAACLLAVLFVALAAVAATTPDNLPRALEAQRALVAARPNDAAAWNDLGNLLVLAGDDEQARSAYERAVELAPASGALHFNLALHLQQQGDLRHALAQYRAVVELEPGNAWAHYQIGVIRESRGEQAKAIDSYGRALRLDATLAFPDVNPQVIESELLTEAMLRGYRPGPLQPRAPRVYQEPRRISDLLLSDGGDAEGGVGQVVTPPEESTVAAVEPPAEETAAPAEPGDRRVLREADLDDRPVNQAAPQSRGGYRPPTRPSRTPATVRSFRPTTGSNEGRTVQGGTVQGGTVQGGTVQDGSEQPANPSGNLSDPVNPALRGRRAPIPVDSTGRLDVYLAPSEDGAR